MVFHLPFYFLDAEGLAAKIEAGGSQRRGVWPSCVARPRNAFVRVVI
jgi:hypothetical protein